MLANKIIKVAMPATRFCAFKQTAMIAMQSRGFSSMEMISRSSAKLTKALEKEIKYENDNYSQLDDIESFIRESGFTFSEEEDGIHMSLTKTMGDKKIEVTFESR